MSQLMQQMQQCKSPSLRKNTEKALHLRNTHNAKVKTQMRALLQKKFEGIQNNNKQQQTLMDFNSVKGSITPNVRKKKKNRRQTVTNGDYRLMDPDLLLEPDRLGIQMLVPTHGHFIHFSSGLIIHRSGMLAQNPVELQDKAMAEKEKKIRMYEHLLKMDQEMNMPIDNLNKKSVFDIYTKTSKQSALGTQKIKRETIVKNLEEERKMLNKIKDGTYELNFKQTHTNNKSIGHGYFNGGKLQDSPIIHEPQTSKLIPGKKLLSIFETQTCGMYS